MATIYKFLVEQRITQTNVGRKGESGVQSAVKSASKKGASSLSVGSKRGGVEHNRRLRAINPLLNKATHGYWEKGMRVGRAGLGLVKTNADGSFAGLSGVAATILISFIIQTVLKIQNQQREHAQSMNRQNFKMLENGIGAVHNEYEIGVNLWDSRATYNQNK